MKIWFSVYTKSLRAATEAFRRAHECNAKDLTLRSQSKWPSKELDCYELEFLAERQSEIADYIDQGPFAAFPEDL